MHLRPGHRARRRPRLDPDPRWRSATCSSSTRSTAWGRVVEERLYSAMEDFALDPRDRQGAFRALDAAAAQALHRRRGHYTRRALLPPYATASAPPTGWNTTTGKRWRRSSAARRASSRIEAARGRRARDRTAGARHATHRQPAGARAFVTTPRCAPMASSPRDVARAALEALEVDEKGHRPPPTARCC